MSKYVKQEVPLEESKALTFERQTELMLIQGRLILHYTDKVDELRDTISALWSWVDAAQNPIHTRAELADMVERAWR